MKIVTPAKKIRIVTRHHHFDFADMPGAGFAFEVAEDGTHLNSNDAAVANYAECRTGVVNGKRVIDCGIITAARYYRIHAEGRCACGSLVELSSSWANPCDDCDREYTLDGSLLAPRSQWGEETGERF